MCTKNIKKLQSGYFYLIDSILENGSVKVQLLLCISRLSNMISIIQKYKIVDIQLIEKCELLKRLILITYTKLLFKSHIVTQPGY